MLAADGYRSVVTRKLGLYHVDPRHWVVAIRQYFDGVSGLRDQIELHYVDNVRPGYFWIFPLENGSANVGIGMLFSVLKAKKVNLVHQLAEVIRDPHFATRFADAKPMEKPTGWHLPVGSTHRRSSGAGFMVLGDAAGLIDPFTGEGIANAMYSARRAVETARLACDERDFSDASLSRYEAVLWTEIGNELNVSTKLRNIARIRPLLNGVLKKAAGSQSVQDTICAMIAEETPREQLTNPLFYLKLFAS